MKKDENRVMGESPLIVELEQVHKCVSCDASERLHGIKIRWLMTLSSDRNTVTNLFEIGSDELAGMLERSRSLKEVREVRVVQKGERTSWVAIRADNCISTAPKLASSGVAWLQPTYSQNGTDVVTLFAPSYHNYRKFLEIVEGNYDIRLKSKRFITTKEKVNFDIFSSSGYLQLKSASELLTPRQYELFDLACRYGYYEEPKKVSLQELGAKLGISESTAAELLRKSERKLMPIMSDIMRVMR